MAQYFLKVHSIKELTWLFHRGKRLEEAPRSEATATLVNETISGNFPRL